MGSMGSQSLAVMGWGYSMRGPFESTAAERIARKLRATRPPTPGRGAADKKARGRGNASLPSLGAPASFKRMLGDCLKHSGQFMRQLASPRDPQHPASKANDAQPSKQEW